MVLTAIQAQGTSHETTPLPGPVLFSRSHLGDVAQLGERLLCKQEVAGSIPVVSTEFQIGIF